LIDKPRADRRVGSAIGKVRGYVAAAIWPLDPASASSATVSNAIVTGRMLNRPKGNRESQGHKAERLARSRGVLAIKREPWMPHTDRGSRLHAWHRSFGGEASWLGRIRYVEEFADGRGVRLVADGGSIYSTNEFGTYALGGPILAHWQELGAQDSWLGYPVSDVLRDPTGQFTFAVFEHGYIDLTDEGSPIEHPHDYLRLYGQLRQQILTRFFAIGSCGRRNLLGANNLTRSSIPSIPLVKESFSLDEVHKALLVREALDRRDELATESLRARWDTIGTGGENPHLLGTWLFAMLAVEDAAGNSESTNALLQALETVKELTRGAGGGQIPTRWDAGAPTDDHVAFSVDFACARKDPPDAEHRQQFVPRNGAPPLVNLAPSDFHHHPWRHRTTLERFIGADQAAEYEQRQCEHFLRYRVWEPSMDEVVGMVTSLWLVNKLTPNKDVRDGARMQALSVGQCLADKGYVLVRPLGGLSYRGATGVLPMMEEPIARALFDITGEDFHSSTSFQEAMEFAGHWRQLAGPIGAWQAAAWVVGITGLADLASVPSVLPAILSLVPPPLDVPAEVGGEVGVATAVALVELLAGWIAETELIFAGQIISPTDIGAALAILTSHFDCFDVGMGNAPYYGQQSEIATAMLGKAVADKPRLYRSLVEAQGFGKAGAWSVAFPGFLCLTGLDSADSLVSDVFKNWFNSRSRLSRSDPNLEPPGTGASVTCWVAGVATLLENNAAAEAELIKRLDAAVCHLFAHCYFDPQIPAIAYAGGDSRLEQLCVNNDMPIPYGPLDFCAGLALACWHARRRMDAGDPITTERFPQPLSDEVMASWPAAGVPTEVMDVLQARGLDPAVIQQASSLVEVDGVYPLFLKPAVQRRQPPGASPFPSADVLTDIQVFFVDPQATTELDTGISLQPGQALEVRADGDIWAGDLLQGRNGPDGLDALVDDASWPLHTGLSGAANKFCLLGRLNGDFAIGSHFPRQQWMYHEPRDLFLRINDFGPGDGNGAFVVRVDVFGPKGSVAHPPYDPLRDGGLLRTDEPRDRIFMHVEQRTSDESTVEFALETPDDVTWRKEILIRSGDGGRSTIYTQDARHDDASGLLLEQLPGGSLVLRRMNFGGGMAEVSVLTGLDEATPGTRIVFFWYQD
jgi:hypothetical protein